MSRVRWAVTIGLLTGTFGLALAIADAADQFNLAQREEDRLPARMGLTVGTVTIHSDADRGVFNVFGDAMNVAARLRDLNRNLGSRILASEDVVRGLDSELLVRPIGGNIALKGVARPPVVFEVVGLISARDEQPASAASAS